MPKTAKKQPSELNKPIYTKPNLPHVNSDLENLIALRNEVGQKMVSNLASALFYQRRAKKLKNNTQDKVNMINSEANERKNAAANRLYLECIDELIEQGKAELQ